MVSTPMDMLKLAEEVAELRGLSVQFLQIYFQHRQHKGIRSSVELTLDELKLWDTYHEYC